MNDFFREAIFLATIINPIAVFVYLAPVRQKLPERDFLRVLFMATLISMAINMFFTITGEWIFRSVFKIDFNSFRIFGGIVLLSISLMSIVQGQKALINTRGSLDDIASEVAMPFMAGVGTISVCILMGSKMGKLEAVGVNLVVAFAAFVIVAVLASIRYHLNNDITAVFDKVLAIMIRINGFFMGAFGVDMVKTGIINIINQ